MITLSRFDNGDTNYVSKHNSNADTLESIINALQVQIGGAPALLSGNTGEALFGAANSIVVEGSYLPTGSGTDLTVAAGYFWHFATQTVRRKLTSTVISFSGLSAATYYIVVDALGEPARSDTSTGACYSVVWTGSAFGTITRLVPIAWGYGTFDAAKVSTALGATYQSLDTRLEAGEAAPIAALATHVAASDPHTGYQKESEKGVANGYASLDSGGLVPSAQLPGASSLPVVDTTAIVKGSSDATKQARLEADGITTGTTRVLTVQNKDYTLAGTDDVSTGDAAVYAAGAADLAAHVAASDPHTGYQRESEKGAASGYASLDGSTLVPAAQLPAMVGDSGSGGTKGAAPAPAAGDAAAGKFLKADGTWAAVSGASGGTVTSVALTVPAELSVSGSPITSSGTLAVTKANQSANQVFAGPTSGGAAAPAFRALVAADIPLARNLVLEQIVFGFATDVTTGDGAGYMVVPSSFNGLNLVRVHARVITAGTTGTTDIQIANVTDSVDMLSTKLTIDSAETGSDTAATAAVIDTAHDDVATNDLLRIDIDAVSTTKPRGLLITLEFA